MKKRLFTFGCSFTNYIWPTWADILAMNYRQYQNWGRVGAGNHFIFYSLIEAISRSNITVDDTVAIMWTSIAREDRYIKDQWFTPGSIYNSPYPKNYVDEFTDPAGFFLTNITIIDAAKQLLDGIGCQYHFFSMIPFEKVDDFCLDFDFLLAKNTEAKVKKLYQRTLEIIRPSVFEVIFNEDWESRGNIIIPSAQKNALEIFQIKYESCAGPNWPKFIDFVEGKISNIDRNIMFEIEEQFQFLSWRDKIFSSRQDFHPIPNEHAEYLEKLGFELSDRQIDFAQDWTDQLLTNENIKFKRNKFERF